jgi:hypothetical protein
MGEMCALVEMAPDKSVASRRSASRGAGALAASPRS